MYTVYVLYSPEHKKHYTGFTSDLEVRLYSHNHKGNGWTAKFRPWITIYTRQFVEKKAAMTYEKWLKTGAGRDFIKTIPH